MTEQSSTQGVVYGAQTVKIKASHLIIAYFTRHLQSALGSLGELYRAPIATTVTVFVIAITLALPISFFLFIQNIQLLTNQWPSTAQMTLYLSQDIPKETLTRRLNNLKKHPHVQAFEHLTPTLALEEFEKKSGLNEITNLVDNNPLPHVVTLVPKTQLSSSVEVQALFQELKRQSYVEHAHMDTDWIDKLFTLMAIAKRAAWVIAILLYIGAMLIVGNTIRLIIQNQRQEITITHLIGGTHAFIRRPFLYMGVWYGILGGITAILITQGIIAWLQSPAQYLAQLYSSQFLLTYLNGQQMGQIIGVSIALGVIAAYLVVNRFLKQLQVE